MTTKNILIGVIALLVLILLISYFKNKGKTCYELPENPNPTVFGPKYWAALHSMMSSIPCGTCRGFAEKFMIFFHDVINLKTNKPVYDPANYSEMMLYLNSPKAS